MIGVLSSIVMIYCDSVGFSLALHKMSCVSVKCSSKFK